MSEVVIAGLVEGGKASGGPPLGPALGPLGVNTAEVVAKINSETKNFEGIKVPIKVIVDTSTKKFRIEVGSPPTSALILKEIGATSGGKTKGEIIGDIKLEQVKKIAESKAGKMHGRNFSSKVKQVLGTCKSMGVTCDGMDPRAVIAKINSKEISV
ncbi:MAG: 50S ribosomal protein L11 [Candidatus Micrarchaeaceae archaeon]